MKFVLFLYFCIFSVVAHADLLVAIVKESTLTYDSSKNNYDNSPSNYDNSISNYDNSSSNYNNSESNYNNSSSNYNNGANGNNCLILKDAGKSYHVGYYVRADNGVLNFFSNKGKRLFYNTGKSIGVFEGNKGFFCGTLGRTNGNYQLTLTEIGEQVLMLAQ